VLSAGDEVELYLTFPLTPDGLAPVRAALDGLGQAVPAAAGWRVTLDAEPASPGCLEVSWRKAVR
jgi:hypothetical protein